MKQVRLTACVVALLACVGIFAAITTTAEAAWKCDYSRFTVVTNKVMEKGVGYPCSKPFTTYTLSKVDQLRVVIPAGTAFTQDQCLYIGLQAPGAINSISGRVNVSLDDYWQVDVFVQRTSTRWTVLGSEWIGGWSVSKSGNFTFTCPDKIRSSRIYLMFTPSGDAATEQVISLRLRNVSIGLR